MGRKAAEACGSPQCTGFREATPRRMAAQCRADGSTGGQHCRPDREDVRLLQQLGVGCVVDLRSGQETERAPSASGKPQGVDYYAVPMLDQVTSSAFQGKLPERMGEVYGNCSPIWGAVCADLEVVRRPPGQGLPVPLYRRKGPYRRHRHAVAAAGRGAAGSCYSGLQRHRPLYERELCAAKRWAEETFGKAPPDHVFSSDPAEIEMALAYLEEEYGTARDYLRQNGASEELLRSIREMLLSPRG